MRESVFRLDGQVAIVTGGTAGIGLASARSLAGAGAHVVVCGRDVERGRRAEQELTRAGKAQFIRCDVTDEQQVADFVAAVARDQGPPRVLINNAGPTDLLHSRDVDGPVGTVGVSQFEELMSRTVTSVFLPTKHVIRHMVGIGGGSIINISSMSATIPIPGFDVYAVGKGAVEAMTRSVVASYRHLNIRCNTIRVGRIAVDHGGGLKGGAPVPVSTDPDAWRQPVLPPAGSAEDVALAVLFLASPAGSYVNGVVLPVDGGAGVIGLMPWQTPRPEMLSSLEPRGSESDAKAHD